MGKTLKNISPRIELWIYQYIREQLAKGNIEEAKDTILQTVVKPHLFGSYMNDKRSCISGNGPATKRWAKKLLRRAIRIEGKNECREALMDPTAIIPIEWDLLAELDRTDHYCYFDSCRKDYLEHKEKEKSDQEYWDDYIDDFWDEDDEETVECTDLDVPDISKETLLYYIEDWEDENFPSLSEITK